MKYFAVFLTPKRDPFLKEGLFSFELQKTFCEVKERLVLQRGPLSLLYHCPDPSAIPSSPQSLIFASSGRSEDPNSFQGPTKATFSNFEILQDSFLLTSSYLPYPVSLDSSSCSPSSPTLPSNHFKYSHYCRFLKNPLLFCRPTA